MKEQLQQTQEQLEKTRNDYKYFSSSFSPSPPLHCFFQVHWLTSGKKNQIWSTNSTWKFDKLHKIIETMKSNLPTRTNNLCIEWSKTRQLLSEDHRHNLHSYRELQDKLEQRDNHFRQQLQTIELDHRQTIKQVKNDYQDKLDKAQEHVNDVEQEMRILLNDTNQQKLKFNEKIKQFSQLMADLQHPNWLWLFSFFLVSPLCRWSIVRASFSRFRWFCLASARITISLCVLGELFFFARIQSVVCPLIGIERNNDRYFRLIFVLLSSNNRIEQENWSLPLVTRTLLTESMFVRLDKNFPIMCTFLCWSSVRTHSSLSRKWPTYSKMSAVKSFSWVKLARHSILLSLPSERWSFACERTAPLHWTCLVCALWPKCRFHLTSTEKS